ncbi:MAG: dynamin family protein [Bryobacteraceae bacterium]|jgi:GTP-binding protein EngB required for normal cell division
MADAFDPVGELAAKYRITSILPLLETCRTLSRERILRIAVFGRFKAGKSSFLNDLIGRDLIPTGVIPVTSVVTEIGYGATERATVRYLDGREEEAPVDSIRWWVTEAENPENVKQVAVVLVELPSLEKYDGVRFVDTPGLDSVFTHNTEASLNWLPNVGLALVATAVDPPLSQQDIALIRKLYEFTPRVTVLLTKVDVLSGSEQREVRAFVDEQLRKSFEEPPPVYPYSVRPGYESARADIEQVLVRDVLGRFNEQREAIVRHKTGALLRECRDYLSLALKSAEALDSERDALRTIVLGERASLDEFRTQLRLIARHAAGATRDMVTKRFEPHEAPIARELADALRTEYPHWTRSLAHVIDCFDRWLARSLTNRLGLLSAANRLAFAEHVDRVKRQIARSVQDFRARLSERTTAAFGVPLRMTEIEMEAEEPRTPDINVGKVFDRNWELLGFLIPMWLFQGLIRRHLLQRRIPYEVFKNLSRLTSQWEENINAALRGIERQAAARLDELMATIENLLARAGSDAPALRSDLQRLEELETSLGE